MTIHAWFTSFLKKRSQCLVHVVIDGVGSDKVHVNMDMGFPQGTVIGPLLFLPYISMISKLPNEALYSSTCSGIYFFKLYNGILCHNSNM